MALIIASVIIIILFIVMDLIKIKCPDCNGECEGSYNAEIDKVVYTCKSCGKQWV